MQIYSTGYKYSPVFNGNDKKPKPPKNNSFLGVSKDAITVPISIGWKALFGNFGKGKFDDYVKKYPEETKLLRAAKSVDLSGNECARFNQSDMTLILSKVDFAHSKGRDCKKILNTMLEAKDYGEDITLTERFGKYDICNVLDAYAQANPKLVEKIVSAENQDKYGKSLYQFESGDIKNVVNIVSRNPDLVKAVIKADKVPDKETLSTLSHPVDGENLNGEQIDVALVLMDTNDKYGNPILSRSWTLLDETKRCLKNSQKSELPLILDLCQSTGLRFEPASNFAKGLISNDPEQIGTIKSLLDKDIKIDNYAQADNFLKLPVEEQKKLFVEIDKNREFISNNSVNIMAVNDELSDKIDYMQNERYFVPIADEYRNLMFSDRNVPLAAVKGGIALVKKVPEELLAINAIALNNAFILGVNNKLGFVSDSFTNEYMNTLRKLPDFDDDSRERLSNILVYNFDSILEKGDVGTLSKNIDYFNNKDLGGYGYEQVENILFSKGENLKKKREQLDEVLANDCNKIFAGLRQKCSNLPPDYGENIIGALENEKDYEQLILLPKISKEEIVRSAFGAAKIISCVIDNPKDYLNGQYNEKVMDVVTSDFKHIPLSKSLVLTSEEGIQIDEAKEAINDSIYSKIPNIANAIAITDFETVKLMLDKRLTKFSEEVDELQRMHSDDKKLLSDIIRNGKRINKNGYIDKLSGRQKLDMVNMVKLRRDFIESGIGTVDFNQYKEYFNDNEYVIDIDSLHKDMLGKVLQKHGLSEAEQKTLKPENLNWDMANIGLLGKKIPGDRGELTDVVREASKGEFANYISDTSNKYGKANAATKKSFADANLNFSKWDKGAEPFEFSVGGHWYAIKNWTRTPQKSLMDGTYTDSCTALDKLHGSSMANYLLNKAVNVVEVTDENGNVAGMSRCFVGKVNGKQSMIIENIEVNKSLQSDIVINHYEQEYIDNIFRYFEDYADSVGGANMPVYLSTGYMKLDEDALKDYSRINASVGLTGEIANDNIYMNIYQQNVNPKTISSRTAELYVVRGGEHI